MAALAARARRGNSLGGPDPTTMTARDHRPLPSPPADTRCQHAGLAELDVDPPTSWSSSAPPSRALRLVAHPLRDRGLRRAVRSRRAGIAWTTGLVKWENDPKPGWYDIATGDLVPEDEIVERYHDAVLHRCGIRELVADGALRATTPPICSSASSWTATSASWFREPRPGPFERRPESTPRCDRSAGRGLGGDP